MPQIKFGSRPVDYEPPEYRDPVCPRCKCECETIYYDMDGNAVACDVCVSRKEASLEPLCFPEE